MLPTALSIKPHRFPSARIKEEKEEAVFFINVKQKHFMCVTLLIINAT